MSDPLSSFASLVPTPAPSRSRASSPAQPSQQVTSSQDPFASLLASDGTQLPTTAKSSSYAPIFSNPVPNSEPTQLRPRHARGLSEADWGTFVSVPASQDPLADAEEDFASPVAAPAIPYAPDPSFEFFESFGESAKQASSAKRKSVLDELLAHEDDPLYFLSESSAKPPPQPPIVATRDAPSLDLLDAHPLVTASPPPIQPLIDPTHHDTLFHTEAVTSPTLPAPPFIDRRTTDPLIGAPAFTPSETHATDLLAEALSSSYDPPAPITAAAVETPHPEPSRSTSFAARWMPTLRAGRISPSQSTLGTSPSSSGTSSLTATLTRSVTAALTAGPSPPTRENPFASHIFQPTSGAPGYAGERPQGPAAKAAKQTKFDFGADDVEEKRALLLEGRKASTIAVLTPALAARIRASLPVLVRLSKSWELLYSLDQHGISLRTLYARCAEPSRRSGQRPALLVIQAASGESFGAFVGEGIHPSPGTYYGGGESFLWRTDNAGAIVDVYRWTGRNDYVALCELDSLSFGGGEGHYGLFLDDVLQDGSSARCPTFGNEPLCAGGANAKAKSVPFECVGVEVWAIGT